ncbi:MAG: endolytic transglycosylase MltG [Flavobacteriales bacterium]|nr:endolytic transglycosylase MltG [Flavobacteriales bacterium]
MRRWRIIALVIGILALATAVVGWSLWRKTFGPGPGFAQPERVLLIPSGADLETVVDSLNAGSMIADEQAFRLLAKRKKYADHVRSGRYLIPSGISLNELINKLRSGEQDPVRITFTNIRTLPELAGRLDKYLEVDSTALLVAMRDPATMDRLGFTGTTMISLFIPNTYEVWWNEAPADLLSRMAREYSRFWSEERRAKAAASGLALTEVSTLASIVQAETAKRDEAPRIAGVYLNRLRIGMPLQADPTLKFALGLDSVNRVLDADKRVDSPYNTYTHTGLPPGPINMPEPVYLDAVLDAAKHDYLYFCARETLDGYSNFATTYEQHLVNARRYQKALNARGILR